MIDNASNLIANSVKFGVFLDTDDAKDLQSFKRAYKIGFYRRIVPGFETEVYTVTDHRKFAETMRAAEAAAVWQRLPDAV